MNDVLEAIIGRRSVRKYRDELPDPAAVDKVIECGLYAPSGYDRQDVVMISITDRKTLDDLSREDARYLPAGIGGDPFYGAPMAIAVLANADSPTHVYDGSLAMGNLMLAAHAQGLGSCWINRAKQVFESEYGVNLLKGLGIEGKWEGIGFCILGYPAEELPEPPERKGGRVYRIE